MPPLSAYTPFESLLFFQSLATFDAGPASFAKISEVLRNNKFVRDNALFDTDRLSPEALEELYTTLIEEWQTDGRATPAATTNPKKRKISPPPAGDLGKSRIAVLPGLVSHLYARYKELVTKEIRDEEKKYKEIAAEITRLEKEQEVLPPSAAQDAAPAKTAESLSPPKAAPLPQAMDIDVAPKPDHPPKLTASPVKALEPLPIKAPIQEGVIQNQQPLQPAAPQGLNAQIQIPVPPAPPTQPAQLPSSDVPPQIHTATPDSTIGPVSQSGIPPEQNVSAAGPPSIPQPEPVNAKAAGVTLPPQPPQAPSTPVQGSNQTKIAPAQPQQPLQPPPNLPPPPTVPSGPQAAFPAAKGPNVPVPPSQARPMKGEAAGRKVPIPGTLTMPSFQQWSPNTNTKTPIPNVSPLTNHPHSNQTILEHPPPGKHASPGIPGTGGRMPAQHLAPAPLTPGALRAAVHSPLPDIHGQQTPKLARTPSMSTSFSKRVSRASIDTSGSLTPWKRSPKLSVIIPQSPGSPPRPRPEDVSPISERGVSPFEGLGEPQKKGAESERGKSGRRGRKRSPPPLDLNNVNSKVEKAVTQTRSRRAGSTTSTRSRARSVGSRDEESANDTSSTRRIKNENPPTPAGISEDTEVETRAGRRRNLTITAPVDDIAGKTRGKRKRGLSEAFEIEAPPSSAIREDLPSNVVLCTRNFPRTGAPVMNEVAGHKLAGIFGKPITEKEAPGYKDLIYRPQDLKSIKSAIHQGSRAVAAATEATSTPADGESPLPGTPSKNAVLMLQKTADLIPPKAIVNSSQLEKELIRMFANAVMYNAASERERGFGPAFPLTKDGKGSDSDKHTPREKSAQPWGFEDGGMVHDTREMYEDVEKAVTRWRAAERTVEEMAGPPNKSFLSLRTGSAGDWNAEGES